MTRQTQLLAPYVTYEYGRPSAIEQLEQARAVAEALATLVLTYQCPLNLPDGTPVYLGLCDGEGEGACGPIYICHMMTKGSHTARALPDVHEQFQHRVAERITFLIQNPEARTSYEGRDRGLAGDWIGKWGGAVRCTNGQLVGFGGLREPFSEAAALALGVITNKLDMREAFVLARLEGAGQPPPERASERNTAFPQLMRLWEKHMARTR